MEHAIAFAETGHLCLSTLHANSTNQALDRIINFFPDERRDQLLMDLSLNLKSVISQRLLPIKDEEGRVPAVEILLNTPLMADLIFKGQVHEMKALIAKSNELGMQTFDQHLFHLIEAGLITMEDGLRNADSVNDLRLRLKLDSKDSKDQDLLDGTAGLMVEETDDEAGLIAPVKRANHG
jgi:twitching motility protein PilU